MEWLLLLVDGLGFLGDSSLRRGSYAKVVFAVEVLVSPWAVKWVRRSKRSREGSDDRVHVRELAISTASSGVYPQR